MEGFQYLSRRWGAVAIALLSSSGNVWAAYPEDAPWPVFRGDDKNAGHARIVAA